MRGVKDLNRLPQFCFYNILKEILAEVIKSKLEKKRL